jgi:hypothetical protein
MDPAKAAQIVEVLNGLTARDQVKRLQEKLQREAHSVVRQPTQMILLRGA